MLLSGGEILFFNLPDFAIVNISLLLNRYASLKVSLNFGDCIFFLLGMEHFKPPLVKYSCMH